MKINYTDESMSSSVNKPLKKCAIALSNVIYRYPKSIEPILHIENWQVGYGEHVFIHGRSGSGKSTLLNLLAGILTADEGDIHLLEQSLSALNSRQRDAFRAKNIGMVFQQFNLVPYLSVLENIQLAAHFARTTNEVAKQRCHGLFAGLSLDPALMNRRADSLSVGQQQRVAIARALINHPSLLIVDEPTSALDSEAKSGFMTMLMQLANKNQTTLIFVSHDETLLPFFSQNISMSDLNLAGAGYVD